VLEAWFASEVQSAASQPTGDLNRMQSGFGAALRKLRERRTLSIRELGRLADIDHAYVYRLEQGEKTSPSPELLATLLSVLKANPRDSAIVKWLVDHSDTWDLLVEHCLEDPTVTLEEFTMAAGIRHRGNARPTPSVLIDRVRRALSAGDE
jgi:HTH-type transcriptional regulator, competence development regulator